MTKAKGADLIPEIYDALKERGTEFTLVICTSGGELSAGIEEWSASKSDVQFKGFVDRDRISRLYAEASVAIFPSRKEAFPIACLEAQAAGTPLVISDVPGLTQAVVSEKTGVIAGGPDGESFGKAITEVYALWKTRRQDYLAMCRAAQENVRENFQWKRSIEKLVELLQSSAGI
jgi:alpha-1,6-mannosyltransferase